ncbi:MAG: hypothetical protein H6607_07500 [Flavobacteriales bacterium]|nr:hypothetical protein [Flavobacteriales bacterium]
MTKRILLIIISSLLLGAVIGFFVAGRLTKNRINQMVEHQRPPMFKNRLAEKLNLTEMQQQTFDSVFMEHVQRMKAIDASVRTQRDDEFDKLFGELEKGLDATQIQTLRKFKERREQRRNAPKGRPPME